MNVLEKSKKWCSWCRKDNHNDDECWSTRSADWIPRGRHEDPLDVLARLIADRYELRRAEQLKDCL